MAGDTGYLYKSVQTWKNTETTVSLSAKYKKAPPKAGFFYI
jgi:hypothetical protein